MKKIGLLGGGQLARMLLQEAANYPFEIHILDPDNNAPARDFCANFNVGDFGDEQTVLDFAKNLDIVAIEIEHVNTAALKILQAQGKKIIPSAQVLETIQDKGKQKKFYVNNEINSMDFYLLDSASAIDLQKIPLPFVQKTRSGGYDGRGVQIINNEDDLAKLWDVPSVIERLCEVEVEIAVLVATDGMGDVLCYPIFEMFFNKQGNVLESVFAPARISEEIEMKAIGLAEKTAMSFASAGLFAVEMFVDSKERVWVNETAPRVHNSAHLSIEACVSSQFDQMLRILTGESFGHTQQHRPAAMLNILAQHHGASSLPYLNKLLEMDEVFVHWYGKKEARVGRKMGHITIMADDFEHLKQKFDRVQTIITTNDNAAAQEKKHA